MTDKLLGCPFCGGIPWVGDGGYSGKQWVIACHNQNCPVKPELCKETEAETISAWNRRPSQWVSVEERLPKRGQFYLVVNGSSTVKEAYLDGGNEWIDMDNITLKYVSHWMPLPDPPEVSV